MSGYIDFPAHGLAEYTSAYARVLDNVFSAEDCTLLRGLVDDSDWRPANLSNRLGDVDATYRNSDRVLLFNADVAENLIWERLRPFLDDIKEVYPGGQWSNLIGPGTVLGHSLVGVNERLSMLKYGLGHFFKPHTDRIIYLHEKAQRSRVTIHIYLNGGSEDPLAGGATRFHSQDDERFIDVSPLEGRVLLFQQRDLIHSGEEVTAGLKYTLRTDLMYHPLPADSLRPLEPPISTDIQWEHPSLARSWDGYYAKVMDNVFSPAECDMLIAAAGTKWEPALINTGGGNQALMKDVRNSDRILRFDSLTAEWILERLRPLLEDIEEIKPGGKGEWMLQGVGGKPQKLVGINERLSFLRYTEGPWNYFRTHYDGVFERPGREERSLVTLQIYLGDDDVGGGATRFFALNGPHYQDVKPVKGRVLVFQHQMLHSGEPTTKGTKYAMRTDLMFANMDGSKGDLDSEDEDSDEGFLFVN